MLEYIAYSPAINMKVDFKLNTNETSDVEAENSSWK